jgi:hypothetical protein
MRFGSILKENRNFNRSGTNEIVLPTFVYFVTFFVELSFTISVLVAANAGKF